MNEAAGRGESSRCLFYYAGHGTLVAKEDADGTEWVQAVLCPADFDRGDEHRSPANHLQSADFAAIINQVAAERVKFAGVMLFTVLWFTFAYLPMAHMVWFWDGPDAIKDDATLKAVTDAAGWLWAKGALDFAGGTVVHINAGVAGLIGAYLVGKRIGYGREALRPHSLTADFPHGVSVGAASMIVYGPLAVELGPVGVWFRRFLMHQYFRRYGGHRRRSP